MSINNSYLVISLYESLQLQQTNSFHRSPQYLRNDLYVLLYLGTVYIWPTMDKSLDKSLDIGTNHRGLRIHFISMGQIA